MIIAALYDIHGNAPALSAVLNELGAVDCDLVVLGGDVVAGPFPRRTFDLLDQLSLPVRAVRGNADRSVINAYDGHGDPSSSWYAADKFAADLLTRDQRDRIACWPLTVRIDDMLFCHATPRFDDEIITSLTPVAVLDDALDQVQANVVIAGHTHQQFDRADARIRFVNPGSIGFPYEGTVGFAYWALISKGKVDLRRTFYDVEDAERQIRASGYPNSEEIISRSLRGSVTRESVTRWYESRRRASSVSKEDTTERGLLPLKFYAS